jgi:selenide, water dikinase
MGPEALAQVLRPLAAHTHPNLVVGLQTSDDAAVYALAPGLAIVQTVDFFTPIVDDPWTYGAIAAANSMSDVYAMGGEVLLALNVAGFPETLPADVVTEIFRGAADKVAEAGAVIGGGHTVTDAEPKFGLSVTGRIDPERVLTKAAARPGDRLLLTKPIGTGVISTALKQERCDPAHLDASVASMLTLNRAAAEAIRAVPGVRACTDVTGFGLLGHAAEMAERSGARLQIVASAVPLLPGALAYARAGAVPGGLHRNRRYFEGHAGGIAIDPAVEPALATVLFDPQTSGGLLVAVPEADLPALRATLSARGVPASEIGAVEPGQGIVVVP